MKRPFFKKNPGLFSSLQPSPADFLPSNKKTPPKGVQIRETIGFARPFSAHPSQKNPGIQQVFPDFSISSGRKMPRAKLRSTANREIFVWVRGQFGVRNSDFRRDRPRRRGGGLPRPAAKRINAQKVRRIRKSCDFSELFLCIRFPARAIRESPLRLSLPWLRILPSKLYAQKQRKKT